MTTTTYPLHTGITATVFWLGEPQGAGSSEDNAETAYDDAALAHYTGYPSNAAALAAGVYDFPDRARRQQSGLYLPLWPAGATPRDNPFYCDLPFDDTNNRAARKSRLSVIPWAPSHDPGRGISLMKNRWCRIRLTGAANPWCYAQIEDAGPYVYDDAGYVFGASDARPQSKRAKNAGLDVSPAVRDLLGFRNENDDSQHVDWQFVDDADVEDGPWLNMVTTRQVYQP